MKSLVNRGLGVERETSIDLSGDLAGDDIKDLLAELNEETVQGGVDLFVESDTLLLTGSDGGFDEAGVFGLLGSSQDQGGVGGGILRLVLVDG